MKRLVWYLRRQVGEGGGERAVPHTPPWPLKKKREKSPCVLRREYQRLGWEPTWGAEVSLCGVSLRRDRRKEQAGASFRATRAWRGVCLTAGKATAATREGGGGRFLQARCPPPLSPHPHRRARRPIIHLRELRLRKGAGGGTEELHSAAKPELAFLVEARVETKARRRRTREPPELEAGLASE